MSFGQALVFPFKVVYKVWLFFEKKGKGRDCTEFFHSLSPLTVTTGMVAREERRDVFQLYTFIWIHE